METNYREFIIGFIIPFIAYVLADVKWASKYKALLSLGISIVCGIVLTFLDQDFSSENIQQTILAVIGSTQTTYVVLFKLMGLEKFISPQEAVKDTVTKQIDLTRQQAQRILDIAHEDAITLVVKTSPPS
jgi:hypothetical protein